MLVIARKEGEEIWIDKEKIRIVILNTGKKNVRIGIEAPKNISIIRSGIKNKPVK